MQSNMESRCLLVALKAASGVIANRTTLPILSHVKIAAVNSHVEITGTDLDVTITAILPSDNLAPAVITAPARKLVKILSQIDGNVSLDAKDNKLVLKNCRGVEFGLETMKVEEFPPDPTPNTKLKFHVDAEVLASALKRVAPAMSHDSTRQILNGVCFAVQEDQLEVIACDGHRLAIQELEIEGGGKKERQYIIPTPVIEQLKRLLDKGRVLIHVSEGYADFIFAIEPKGTPVMSVKIACKPIEGSFPNWEQVVPDKSAYEVVLPTNKVLQAIKDVSLMAGDRVQNLRLAFTQEMLTLSASTPEIGEAKSPVPCQWKFKDMVMAFIPESLADGFTACGDETRMLVTDELSPIVLNGTAGDAVKFMYVLMPYCEK